jgi:hypothetical protein
MRWLDDVEEDLRKMRILQREGSEKIRMEICLEGGQGSSRTVAPWGTGTVCVLTYRHKLPSCVILQEKTLSKEILMVDLVFQY